MASNFYFVMPDLTYFTSLFSLWLMVSYVAHNALVIVVQSDFTLDSSPLKKSDAAAL